MKACLIILVTFCSAPLFSQPVVDLNKVEGLPANAYYTIGGSPVTPFRYVRLTAGSPFFRDTWMTGFVVTADGKRSTTNALKLNLLHNEAYFLTPNKEEFVCTFDLKEVVLIDSVNDEGFRFVHSSFIPSLANVKKGWYLPLAEGKASLYLFLSKRLHENKPYNSSVTEQTISTANELWLASNGALHKVKKPKDLPLLLAEKKAELEQYLKSNENSGRSVIEQVSAMVTLFNKIP